MSTNYISQLKELLKTGGVSQTALAKQLGVTFAALNRWVNGKASPHPSKRRAIERLYKETVTYPSIGPLEVRRVIGQVERLRSARLWSRIADNEALQDELLVEHTYNSTTIEGTTFSRGESRAVVLDQAVIRDKSLREHLEVTNHAAVLKDIFLMKFKGVITEGVIRSMHERLMQGLRQDAGSYSRQMRAIGGSTIALTHPKDIPEEMAGLTRVWARSRKRFSDIARFHVSFELIHPFGDGNGRLGRLLMALQCLRAGYPPAVIENERKAEYYEVLEYAQKKSDRPFLRFLAEEMAQTARLLGRYRS